MERAHAYVKAGADMLFIEAVRDLGTYAAFTHAVNVPCLANITEFGTTPLLSAQQLQGVGIAMVLYPLSAFRAMNRAA